MLPTEILERTGSYLVALNVDMEVYNMIQKVVKERGWWSNLSEVKGNGTSLL